MAPRRLISVLGSHHVGRVLALASVGRVSRGDSREGARGDGAKEESIRASGKTLASQAKARLNAGALGLDGSKTRSHEPGDTSSNVPQRLAIGAGRYAAGAKSSLCYQCSSGTSEAIKQR